MGENKAGGRRGVYAWWRYSEGVVKGGKAIRYKSKTYPHPVRSFCAKAEALEAEAYAGLAVSFRVLFLVAFLEGEAEEASIWRRRNTKEWHGRRKENRTVDAR